MKPLIERVHRDYYSDVAHCFDLEVWSTLIANNHGLEDESLFGGSAISNVDRARKGCNGNFSELRRVKENIARI